MASISSFAQTESVRDGSTPSALAAGAPAGSYSLSGFEAINPYNGGLNFSLPLYKVGGRGDAGYSITLRIDQKWSIGKEINPGHSANYTPKASWLDEDGYALEQTYSVGKLVARQGASRDYYTLSPCGVVSRVTLTRLSFTAPDGTEYELRDKQSDGAPHVASPTVCEPQYSRGNVFVTADGSSATFIADAEVKDAQFGSGEGIAPAGVMILKDGTRFHVGALGDIDWMRDRNGNLVTFAYGSNATGGRVITVTDPLGRRVTVTDGSPVVIAYDGFGGADRAIKIYTGLLGTALRTDFQLQTQDALFPGINNPLGASYCNPKVITSVELPDQRTYQFEYDSYGELARVELPTGGAFEYDYAAGLTDGLPSGMFTANNEKQVYRRVVERREYPGGGMGSAYSVKQVYSRPETSAANAGYVEVQQCASGPSVGACGTGAALLSRERHYYYGSPRLSFNKQPYEYSSWQEGREYRTEVYDTQTGALLRKVENTWEQPVDGATWPLQPAQSETNGAVKPNDPQVTQVLTTLADTNQVSKQTYAYDQYGNNTDAYEYDFGAAGSGLPGALLRRTHTGFVTTPAYVNADASLSLGAGLRGLPSQTWVSSDAAGASKASLTSYAYDQYTLADCPNITGHDSAYSTAFNRRGNLTGVTRYSDAAGGAGAVSSSSHYDIAGNGVSATDALGNTTSVDYSDSFSDNNNLRHAYAYPSAVTAPAPDPDEVSYTSAGTLYKFQPGDFGSITGLTTEISYDFSTGLAVSTTDANGETTTFEYNDPLDRITKESRPDGGWTSYQYGRNQWGDYVHTSALLNSSGTATHSYRYTDGLGRLYRSFSNDPTDPNNLWLTTDAQYDSMGRMRRVSNPYRSAGSAGAVNPAGRWTTTAYDELGRVESVTTPDGAVVTTTYSGNQVTVTDQAGRKRSSLSDALGRLTRITEDPTTGGLNYVTNYTYDALGNLRKVDQGGQQRFFMYDSLGRLTRAKNPEQAANAAITGTDTVTANTQWSLSYGYDANGNMTVRVDARGVTTNYTYDHLNRNIITYYTPPAGGGVASTPDVRRYYDNSGAGENGLGRLYWTQTFGVSEAVFDSYDSMGRPTRFRQNFWVSSAWGQPFGVAYSYDKAGNLTSQTYPSGRTVSYTYDAAGRLASFAGTLGDGVQRTYSTGVSYGELGGIQQEQFGTETPLYRKLHYNVRGQLYDARLSTVAWATDQWNWNRGALVNCYSTAELTASASARALSGPDNNGNVRRSYAYAPTDAAGGYTVGSTSPYASYQENYVYDSLNRLTSVTETPGTQAGAAGAGPGGAGFVQAYTYDRWGNRAIDAAATQVYGQNPAYTIPEPQFELSPATNREVAEPSNRLYAPGDAGRAPAQKLMRYDASGNLAYDAYTGQGSRSYDAESRMTQAQDVYQNSSTYTYDGEGRRIKRLSAGQEWWQVYGPGGELLAEYQSGAAPIAATKEYGYRGGELLVTMSSGDDGRVKRFVQNLYYGALQRDPTAQELTDQSNQLASAGVQGQAQLLQKAKDIARSLFTQTSYETSPARTDAQYVTDLYYAYTQRGPDSSGLSFWAGKVATDGRSNVCNGFEASSEFSALVSTLYGAAASDGQRTDHFVNNFYLGAYGRNATSAELQQQSDALDAAAAQGQTQVQAQAEAMGHALYAAQVNDFTITAQQFVTNLYEGFLQRGPDAGGLSFWTGQAGTTSAARQNVLNAFAVSTAARELSGTLYRETFWLVSDHLGTPRMVVGKSGSLADMKRHDYLPFGEELLAGKGGRTTAQGYGTNDNVRQKFTGYESDAETTLDYAQARHFATSHGRFTSSDPAGGATSNPQTLNRYSYVVNNPLKFIDPTGYMAQDPKGGDTDGSCNQSNTSCPPGDGSMLVIINSNIDVKGNRLNSQQVAEIESELRYRRFSAWQRFNEAYSSNPITALAAQSRPIHGQVTASYQPPPPSHTTFSLCAGGGATICVGRTRNSDGTALKTAGLGYGPPRISVSITRGPGIQVPAISVNATSTNPFAKPFAPISSVSYQVLPYGGGSYEEGSGSPQIGIGGQVSMWSWFPTNFDGVGLMRIH